MSLKPKIEAIIYAADEPVTLDQMLAVLLEPLEAELAAGAADAEARSQVDAVASSAEDTTASVRESAPPDATGGDKSPKSSKDDDSRRMKARLRELVEELVAEYSQFDRAMEIREVAGGYRMSTKPEHHDVVRSFVKSLKPPMRLSLPALETLAVVAYKQPVTAPEISEIRGVESAGVLATLIDRKLITTAGRKQVVGRPILYKTTKEFLLRFGLKDVNELPSIEEFEKLAVEAQPDLFGPVADATGVPDVPDSSGAENAPEATEGTQDSPEERAAPENVER